MVPGILLFVVQAAVSETPGAPGSSPAGSSDARVSKEEQSLVSETRLGALLSALRADEFQITRGAMYEPDVLQLAYAGIAPSCNGNNNTNPYLLALVPPAGATLDRAKPPLSFQIRQDEAVVLVGRTPPPAADFRFRSFVLNRFFDREGIRRKVFASLGDPHDMLTLDTAGKAKGDPYDSPRRLGQGDPDAGPPGAAGRGVPRSDRQWNR